MGATTTEEYLRLLPGDQRAALDRLRKLIRGAAPRAEPHFGYGLPGFKLDGHPFIYFGAAKKHCAIYGYNDGVLAEKLSGFKQSKGTIQFTPDNPIPAALVKELVRSRAAANRAKWPAASPKKRARRRPTKKAQANKGTHAAR
jgi:uncharacterized protein YdhG (YjbR/CyaY superfamily)